MNEHTHLPSAFNSNLQVAGQAGGIVLGQSQELGIAAVVNVVTDGAL
jgi:hypothetical protein